jgi:hypothetical protein
MNTIVKLRAVEPAESPAAIARREHEAVLATIDSESASVREKMRLTQDVLAEAQKPATELAVIEAKLADAIGARLAGGEGADDEAELERAAAAKSIQAAAQSVTARGAQIALDKLNTQLTALQDRRAGEMQRRQYVQFAEASEALDALGAKGERLAADLDAFNVEMIAHAIARDHVRPLSASPCAFQFKTAYKLPVPHGLQSFDALGAHRDIGGRVQQRAAEILAELGADAEKIR